MSTLRPKPRREYLRLEVLQRIPALQLRALPEGKTFDEEYVRELLELREGGVEFEPLDVVEEIIGKDKQPRYYIFDGFTRAEVYSRMSAGLVECNLYTGTFEDAKLWALAANAKHGRPRSSDDCQKAFDRLLSSAVLMERVVKDRTRFQGTERAIAATCGLSPSIVNKYLRLRNLRVDRLSGKLIPLDGPLSPERDARQELVGECEDKGLSQAETARLLGVTPATVAGDKKSLKDAKKSKSKGGKVNVSSARASSVPPSAESAPSAPKPEPPAVASGGDPILNGAQDPELPAAASGGDPIILGAQDIVEEIAKQLRSVAKKIDDLLRSRIGTDLRRIALVNEIPLRVTERDVMPIVRPGDAAKGQIMVKERTETWPALVALMATFGGLSAELAQAQFGREKD